MRSTSVVAAALSVIGVLSLSTSVADAEELEVLCGVAADTRVSILGTWRSPPSEEGRVDVSWWSEYSGFGAARQYLLDLDVDGVVGSFIANDDRGLVVLIDPNLQAQRIETISAAIDAEYPDKGPPYQLVKSCFSGEDISRLTAQLSSGQFHQVLRDWLESDWDTIQTTNRWSSIHVSYPSGGHVVVGISHYPPGLREILERDFPDDLDRIRVVVPEDEANPTWGTYVSPRDLPLLEELRSPLPTLEGQPGEPSDKPSMPDPTLYPTLSTPSAPFTPGHERPTNIGSSATGLRNGAIALGVTVVVVLLALNRGRRKT